MTVSDINVGVTDAGLGGAVDDDDLDISWEESDNGRGGWRPVDDFGPDDGTGDHPTLTLPDGEGKYYRAVVSYDSDGDGDGTETESVYSDPVQASDLHAIDAVPTPRISGSAFPGGTLSVNAPGATVDVQWQVSRGGNWVDIPGATGSLTLTQANAGQTIRAVVSCHSKSGSSNTQMRTHLTMMMIWKTNQCPRRDAPPGTPAFGALPAGGLLV